MEQVSQTQAARRYRPWAEEDQRQAEYLRGKGLSYRAIGLALDRHPSLVRIRLDPAANAAHRACRQQRYQADPAGEREISRRYRRRHLEVVRERDRDRGYRRRAENQERERARHRRYREGNRDKIRESGRRYRAANVERTMARALRWRQENPEKAREYTRRWYRRNTEQACECSRRNNATRRAARRRALVALTVGQKRERYELFGDQCAYCGSPHRLTVDHVLALKAGGLDESSNIVPACFRCNRSKWANPVEQWYHRQPFFTEARWLKIQRHCPGSNAGQLPLAFSASA